MIYDPEIGIIKIPWNNDATESQKESQTCFNVHPVGKRNLTVRSIANKQI